MNYEAKIGRREETEGTNEQTTRRNAPHWTKSEEPRRMARAQYSRWKKKTRWGNQRAWGLLLGNVWIEAAFEDEAGDTEYFLHYGF